MASHFPSVTEEQMLSIKDAIVPKITNMARKFRRRFRLTSFDLLTHHVTLCARKSIARRDFHFLFCAFVAVLLKINQILDRPITQLVH